MRRFCFEEYQYLKLTYILKKKDYFVREHKLFRKSLSRELLIANWANIRESFYSRNECEQKKGGGLLITFEILLMLSS